MYNGKGVESWDEGNIKYDGDFKAGKKTGKGKFEFDGNIYEGDFLDGQFSGFGTYYFADSGKQYTGQFSKNNIIGVGTMTWPDGSQYKGDFVNGKMEGKGVKNWPNGNYYDGQFKNNLQHGSG